MNKNKEAVKKDAATVFNSYMQRCEDMEVSNDNNDELSSEHVEEISNEMLSSLEIPQLEKYVRNENDSSTDERTTNESCVFDQRTEIKIQLAQWAVEENVSSTAVSRLLKILKPVMPYLPCDARTLKGTPRVNQGIKMEGGCYVHYGIQNSLTNLMRCIHIEGNALELNFNIDGLPVSKSSGAQVWPILMSVTCAEPVLLVGVFEGYSKPNNTTE